MKVNYVNNKFFKKVIKKGALIFITGVLMCTLTGCVDREVATNANVKYDVINTMDQNLATTGIQQILNVPGQDFDLVINYKCVLEGDSKWTITSDKELYMDVSTLGLSDGKQVYIDNVHVDTIIRSHYPSVDGITQDTMDDRIHNSLMLGFPISDSNYYSNVISIEGQNQTFMQGSYYGFNGYASGSISEKRYVESDYLARGVYANKISTVVDLIVVNSNGEMTCVSVPSAVGVSVWPFIERVGSKGSTYRYYFYDEKNGKMDFNDYNEEEYNLLIGEKGFRR